MDIFRKIVAASFAMLVAISAHAGMDMERKNFLS